MGGDPDNEKDIPFLESRSPLNYVDQITRPLLIIHGANDPIIAGSESDQIFEAMEKKGLPALYLSVPDEGHGIRKFTNQMCYLAYTEWILSKYVGGTFEPLKEKTLSESKVVIRSSQIDSQEVLEPITEHRVQD